MGITRAVVAVGANQKTRPAIRAFGIKGRRQFKSKSENRHSRGRWLGICKHYK
jgi:hypothetical protein